MSGMRLSMRVWDLPVRLFHWTLTLLLLVSYVSQLTHHFGVHILTGETLLTLLLWRLAWGVVGSETARFNSFMQSPAAGLRHLTRLGRREVDDEAGHNAAGGWWVLLMLALVLVQVVSGLLGSEKYDRGGPLFHLLPPPAAKFMEQVHAVNFYLLLGAVGVHVLVIGAYAALKGQNLVRPMITGKKRMPAARRAVRIASPGLAMLVLLCSAAAVALMVNGLGR